MTARDEWFALSLAHRVEVMKELDDTALRCSSRSQDYKLRGDASRHVVAARKASNLAMLVDMLKEEEMERRSLQKMGGVK